jgi:hypothetical protein
LSHTVTIQTRVKDPVAVQAACRRLHLPEAVPGTARLFSSQATGLRVQLPGWKYPLVVDITSGTLLYDNYNGTWGDTQQLHRFLQAYAVEMIRLEARKKGLSLHEQLLSDGTIKLTLRQGGVAGKSSQS